LEFSFFKSILFFQIKNIRIDLRRSCASIQFAGYNGVYTHYFSTAIAFQLWFIHFSNIEISGKSRNKNLVIEISFEKYAPPKMLPSGMYHFENGKLP
jgi:hypothetical protein